MKSNIRIKFANTLLLILLLFVGVSPLDATTMAPQPQSKRPLLVLILKQQVSRQGVNVRRSLATPIFYHFPAHLYASTHLFHFLKLKIGNTNFQPFSLQEEEHLFIFPYERFDKPLSFWEKDVCWKTQSWTVDETDVDMSELSEYDKVLLQQSDDEEISYGDYKIQQQKQQDSEGLYVDIDEDFLDFIVSQVEDNSAKKVAPVSSSKNLLPPPNQLQKKRKDRKKSCRKSHASEQLKTKNNHRPKTSSQQKNQENEQERRSKKTQLVSNILNILDDVLDSFDKERQEKERKEQDERLKKEAKKHNDRVAKERQELQKQLDLEKEAISKDLKDLALWWNDDTNKQRASDIESFFQEVRCILQPPKNILLFDDEEESGDSPKSPRELSDAIQQVLQKFNTKYPEDKFTKIMDEDTWGHWTSEVSSYELLAETHLNKLKTIVFSANLQKARRLLKFPMSSYTRKENLTDFGVLEETRKMVTFMKQCKKTPAFLQGLVAEAQTIYNEVTKEFDGLKNLEAKVQKRIKDMEKELIERARENARVPKSTRFPSQIPDHVPEIPKPSPRLEKNDPRHPLNLSGPLQKPVEEVPAFVRQPQDNSLSPSSSSSEDSPVEDDLSVSGVNNMVSYRPPNDSLLGSDDDSSSQEESLFHSNTAVIVGMANLDLTNSNSPKQRYRWPYSQYSPSVANALKSGQNLRYFSIFLLAGFLCLWENWKKKTAFLASQCPAPQRS